MGGEVLHSRGQIRGHVAVAFVHAELLGPLQVPFGAKFCDRFAVRIAVPLALFQEQLLHPFVSGLLGRIPLGAENHNLDKDDQDACRQDRQIGDGSVLAQGRRRLIGEHGKASGGSVGERPGTGQPRAGRGGNAATGVRRGNSRRYIAVSSRALGRLVESLETGVESQTVFRNLPKSGKTSSCSSCLKNSDGEAHAGDRVPAVQHQARGSVLDRRHQRIGHPRHDRPAFRQREPRALVILLGERKQRRGCLQP